MTTLSEQRLAIAGVALWAGIFLLGGCVRGLAPDGTADQVALESVDVRFEPGDRGELVLRVSLPGAPAGRPATITGIQWELWLDDRWFAAGDNLLPEPLPIEGGPGHEVELSLPIAFRRTSPSTGEARELGVGVRGYLGLQMEGDTRRWPFQDRRRIRAANVPALEDAEGD